jgi:hypothetical protein
MVIEQTPGKAKRPRVGDIKEAVARTAEGSGIKSSADWDDVSQWLDEGDSEDKNRKRTDPEGRQFRMDETVGPTSIVDETKKDKPSDTKTLVPSSKKDTKGPGKLPPRPTTQKADSREAAADMLKKFFNRR